LPGCQKGEGKGKLAKKFTAGESANTQTGRTLKAQTQKSKETKVSREINKTTPKQKTNARHVFPEGKARRIFQTRGKKEKRLTQLQALKGGGGKSQKRTIMKG